MGTLHIYRGSGFYCPKDHCGLIWPPEMVHKTHFLLECPECGHKAILMPNLGNLVEYTRKARNMSKAGLARTAGISISTVNRIEGNRIVPREKTVRKIAEALKADTDVFLRKLDISRKANALSKQS